ncbi:hypothetical protein RF11_06266 [Thelohanellus kitauei]|uniref:Uncharacterized protein n=1 Tax=Thelohanellus kitauei TaxID=669202 RepID=A0A0C2M8M6_THEKT|nr:hypothetical protein RF11_06266 [Thelohanellus kitauei]
MFYCPSHNKKTFRKQRRCTLKAHKSSLWYSPRSSKTDCLQRNCDPLVDLEHSTAAACIEFRLSALLFLLFFNKQLVALEFDISVTKTFQPKLRVVSRIFD